MPEKSVKIVHRMGLHARPASEFVKLAGQFSAEVRVCRDELEVNGKSIMGVLMLAAEHGSRITIRTEGEDADEALRALADFVDDGFQES